MHLYKKVRKSLRNGIKSSHYSRLLWLKYTHSHHISSTLFSYSKDSRQFKKSENSTSHLMKSFRIFFQRSVQVIDSMTQVSFRLLKSTKPTVSSMISTFWITRKKVILHSSKLRINMSNESIRLKSKLLRNWEISSVKLRKIQVKCSESSINSINSLSDLISEVLLKNIKPIF